MLRWRLTNTSTGQELHRRRHSQGRSKGPMVKVDEVCDGGQNSMSFAALESYERVAGELEDSADCSHQQLEVGAHKMSARTSLKLPREHGAWAMLYVPFAVGALVGSSSSFSPFGLLLLLLSVTFAFIARQSFLEWWRARRRGTSGAASRRMMFIYFGLGGVFGVAVVLFYHRVWLVPVAMFTAMLLAFNAWQAMRHEDRTVMGETIAILGLTLTAPTAY